MWIISFLSKSIFLLFYLYCSSLMKVSQFECSTADRKESKQAFESKRPKKSQELSICNERDNLPIIRTIHQMKDCTLTENIVGNRLDMAYLHVKLDKLK